MKSVASFALGCKVNQVESEAIAESFAEKGYKVVDINDKADVYVINTCTVTNFGDKKSRQIIRRVKRQNPEAIVVVTGCYSQTAPEDIKKIDGVNIIIGTKGRNKVIEEVEKYKFENGIVEYVDSVKLEKVFEPISINKLMNRCRVYIKVQDGCNQFCSYCIIPYARGPVRSREEESVINEVSTLAKNGFKEIVLTGIHVASYGKDLPDTNLLKLIKKIHPIEGIERIRLSSVEPNIITEDFMKEISVMKKMCHHFHLSLQSGCDRTLKAMRRKYNTKKYINAVETIRKYWSDAAISTDIIVGFPGESEEDFRESCELARNIKFAKIHVFPYSPKKGTDAEKMKNQIGAETKSKRSNILSKIGDYNAKEFIESCIGENVDVLFEHEVGNNVYEGHTSNYINVLAKSDKDIKNKILKVKLTGIDKDHALGEIVGRVKGGE